MRSRPFCRLLAAGLVTSALVVGTTAPADAQDLEINLDFQVDKTEGAPGEEVHGQVDVDDVAEVCPDSRAEIGPAFQAVSEMATSVRDDYIPTEDPYQRVGFEAVQLIPQIIANDDDFAQLFLDQSLVMTFAEVATQDPVGERVNFDRAIGEGTLVVPDIDPGLWAVVATCVLPLSDETTVRNAIEAATETMREAGYLDPEVIPPSERFQWLQDNSDDLLFPLMAPEGLGAQLFCILGPDGEDCEDDPTPPSTDLPSDPDDPGSDPPSGSDDPGTDPPSGSDGSDGGEDTPRTPAATPVAARPAFTG